VLSNPALPAGDVIDLFQSAGVSLEPDTPSSALTRPSAVIQGRFWLGRPTCTIVVSNWLPIAANMAVVRSAA